MRRIPRVVPAFSHWLTHPPHGRSLDIFELQDILWYNEYILGILDILALLDQSFLTQFSVMSREMHGWYFPEYFLIWLCHISTWPTSPSWHGLDTPHPRTWIYPNLMNTWICSGISLSFSMMLSLTPPDQSFLTWTHPIQENKIISPAIFRLQDICRNRID